MAAEPVLLDTGVLVALLHRDDADHGDAVSAVRDVRGELLTTEAVLTESMYLMSRTVGGSELCLEFFIRGGALLVPLARSSLSRCKELIARYRDLPADFADATLITLAEEADTRRVLTLDRRGFSVYRTSDGDGFEILP